MWLRLLRIPEKRGNCGRRRGRCSGDVGRSVVMDYPMD
jgi:hypothetical protein